MSDAVVLTPSRRSRREAAHLAAIVLSSALVGVVLLNGSPVVAIVAAALAGMALVLPIVWRWPVQTAAWLPVFIVPPQFLKIFAYEVVLLVIVTAMMALAWIRRASWALRFDRFELLVWALFAWAAISVLWAHDVVWWVWSIRKMLIGAVALWVALRLPRFVRSEHFLLAIGASAWGLALATMAQAYRIGWFTASGQEFMRRSATDLGWGNANFIAALLAIMLPTALHLVMYGKTRFAKITGWIALPLMAVDVTIAASRGGAVMLLIIALFAIFRSRIKPWMAVTAVAGLALLFLGPGAQQLIERFTEPQHMTSVVIRLWYFREAWTRVTDHWPLGLGHGQGYGYWDRLNTEDPHNYWLVIASELGLVGMVLWIAILVVLWRRIQRLTRDPETANEGRTLQLTYWIAQVNLLFEPTFQGLQYHFLFYWIMGAYLGMARHRLAGTAPPGP